LKTDVGLEVEDRVSNGRPRVWRRIVEATQVCPSGRQEGMSECHHALKQLFRPSIAQKRYILFMPIFSECCTNIPLGNTQEVNIHLCICRPFGLNYHSV